MDFLISPAYAQAGAPPAGGGLLTFLPLVLMLVVLYFLMIRPQQKRMKEHREMLGALKKGDEVVSNGGLAWYGHQRWRCLRNDPRLRRCRGQGAEAGGCRAAAERYAEKRLSRRAAPTLPRFSGSGHVQYQRALAHHSVCSSVLAVGALFALAQSVRQRSRRADFRTQRRDR